MRFRISQTHCFQKLDSLGLKQDHFNIYYFCSPFDTVLSSSHWSLGVQMASSTHPLELIYQWVCWHGATYKITTQTWGYHHCQDLGAVWLRSCVWGCHIARCASVTFHAFQAFLLEAMREAICIHIGQGGLAGLTIVGSSRKAASKDSFHTTLWLGVCICPF